MHMYTLKHILTHIHVHLNTYAIHAWPPLVSIAYTLSCYVGSVYVHANQCVYICELMCRTFCVSAVPYVTCHEKLNQAYGVHKKLKNLKA